MRIFLFEVFPFSLLSEPFLIFSIGFPNSQNRSRLAINVVTLRLCLIWRKKSGRRENYENRWMNLNLELVQIHPLISVIFFPSIFFLHNQTHCKYRTYTCSSERSHMSKSYILKYYMSSSNINLSII
jgi:hypothetical protein